MGSSAALAVFVWPSFCATATRATGLLVAPKAVRGLPPRHLRVDARRVFRRRRVAAASADFLGRAYIARGVGLATDPECSGTTQ